MASHTIIVDGHVIRDACKLRIQGARAAHSSGQCLWYLLHFLRLRGGGGAYWQRWGCGTHRRAEPPAAARRWAASPCGRPHTGGVTRRCSARPDPPARLQPRRFHSVTACQNLNRVKTPKHWPCNALLVLRANKKRAECTAINLCLLKVAG